MLILKEKSSNTLFQKFFNKTNFSLSKKNQNFVGYILQPVIRSLGDKSLNVA